MFDKVFHASLPPYAEGAVELNRRVVLRLRTSVDLPVSCVMLRTVPEGEEVYVEAQLEDFGLSGRFRWWRAELELKVPLLNYRFRIITPQGNYWYSALGLTRYTPTDVNDFRLTPGHCPPAWVYESIFYQIFPDRFYNACPELSVKDGEHTVNGHPVEARAWHDPLKPGCGGREFFGGDIPGIIQKLDYLQELGVNALYLNPIFTAPSNHKYDVANYYEIDPHLGSNQALIKLRQATAERAMKLVLDVVPNHCGNENVWFKKAQADPQAPEAAFFSFTHHPDQYECWLGVRTLPRFNYACEALRNRMYQGENSVLRYWLRPPYAIDGWRLDVANMLARRGTEQLGHKIGRQLRRAVKETNCQAWILGEHFFDGTAHLQGDELDASMNYRGFAVPVLQWLCGTDMAALRDDPGGDHTYLDDQDFVKQMELFRMAVPEQIALGQLNLLDSHDTPRLMSAAGGNKAKVKAALLLMMAYQGVPCLYYGDEIGLTGLKDPDCRRPMPWNKAQQDGELLAYCQKLCRIRLAHPSLRYGSLQWLKADDNCVAFLRESDQEWALVVVRREANQVSSAQQGQRELALQLTDIPEATAFTSALTGTVCRVSQASLAILPLGSGADIWLGTKP